MEVFLFPVALSVSQGSVAWLLGCKHDSDYMHMLCARTLPILGALPVLLSLSFAVSDYDYLSETNGYKLVRKLNKKISIKVTRR